MYKLGNRLLDKRFLIEVLTAGVIIVISRLHLFHFNNVSSPQFGMVLSVFVNYLFNAGALVAVFFIEKREIRSKLFVPFSILLLILTAKYATAWMSVGKAYFQHFPDLSNSAPWLYFQAFFNINFIPILIASFQIGKMVDTNEEKPFYALLLINYITIAFYLFAVSPLISRIPNPRVLDIFLYQLIFYIAVYFLFSYSPYFVSKGRFWKNFFSSIISPFKHIIFTVLVSLGALLFLYIIPFVLGGLKSLVSSQGAASSYYNAIFLLMPFVMYYVFPAFYVITTFRAKQYEHER